MQVAEDMDEAVLAQLEDAQRPSEAESYSDSMSTDEFWDFTEHFCFFSVQGYIRMGR